MDDRELCKDERELALRRVGVHIAESGDLDQAILVDDCLRPFAAGHVFLKPTSVSNESGHTKAV